jgi:hypothetical protein
MYIGKTKEFLLNDVQSHKERVNQLVDILQIDISSSNSDSTLDNKTRKKYEVFTTGVLSENQAEVTSSLFQTVFDQDHELQTSNELLDITFGLYEESSTVQALNPVTDASGKLVFTSDTMMMREKIGMYQFYAQELLGDKESYFTTPFGEIIDESAQDWQDGDNVITDALFINIKRLFTRDSLLEGSLALRLYNTCGGVIEGDVDQSGLDLVVFEDGFTNNNGNEVITESLTGGKVGFVKDENDVRVGLVFYEKGIIVLNMKKVFDYTEELSGNIHTVSGDAANNGEIPVNNITFDTLLAQGTMDDVIDHISLNRFGRGNQTGVSFLNKTIVNSRVYFCTAEPNEFNYSNNPTFKDENGLIRTITSDDLSPFTFITTIGLYNDVNDLVAIAKTSRPIEKNATTKLAIRVKLDY